MKRKVLVAGATGQQGGSVVEALLQDGHTVIGITRNQNSEKAKTPENPGDAIYYCCPSLLYGQSLLPLHDRVAQRR